MISIWRWPHFKRSLRLSSRVLLVLAALVLFAPVVSAQLAPELGYSFPAGGKAGTTVSVQLGGFNWTPDMQFFVHDRRVKLEVLGQPGEMLIPPPPYWFGARSRGAALPIPREVSAKFVLPADLPAGPVHWQVANANGGSIAGIFTVGNGVEIVEDEKRKGPQVLSALPVAVSGRLFKNEEVDHYRFTAARTGPVTLDLIARRIGANFNGMLEVRDTAGKLLAESVDSEGIDPVLTFAATAGTDYVISVRDIDHAGDRSYVYRLNLAAAPRVVAAIPAAGRRGETRPVEFVGYGLATGAAKLESVKRPVTFPATPGIDRFAYRLDTAWGQAAPFELLVSDLPETITPAGDARITAGLSGPSLVHLEIPAAITATLERGSIDRYQFTGKKGQRLAISVDAHGLGSALDALLVLKGADGKELARGDDLPGTTDPTLDYTVPVEGQYELTVSDLAGASRSRAAVYRLAVRPPEDDFHLSTATQRLSVPVGTKTNLAIKLTRSGNFKGPVALTIQGLPEGISTPANLIIPADKAELAVALDVAANAPTSASLATITGTADVGGKKVTRTVVADSPRNLAPRRPQENQLPNLLISTTLKPRCKGSPVDKDTGRKVPRGSTHPAEVTLERLEGFQGEIVLKMAAQQAYQIQGITGGEVVVPPGVTKTFYPCFMPEWLETSRTSRMGIIAEMKVADPRGKVRHLVAPITGFITMTMEGALLKLHHEGRERTVHAGQTFLVHVKLARSPRLPEAVRLELRLPAELPGLAKAETVIVPPNQAEADFRITLANDARLIGDHVLTIRGTAIQPGNLAVVSETHVNVTIAPAK